MAVSTQKYSLIQRVLHWLTLALLLVSFVSHDWMKDAWRAVTRDAVADFTPDTGTQVHVITGGLILVLTLLRLWLRVKQGAPAPVSGQHPLITIASASVHGLLYLLLLALPLTGMAAWFGMFTDLGDVHEVLFNVAWVLVTAHVAAALFHQFVLKDNLLARMR